MELEHRSPKSRYRRTNRKDFEKQLGDIERRQAHIRRIRQKLDRCNKTQEELEKKKAQSNKTGEELAKEKALETWEYDQELTNEKAPETWEYEYHIGKTQNHPIDLRIFSQEKCNDPAAKVLSNK